MNNRIKVLTKETSPTISVTGQKYTIGNVALSYQAMIIKRKVNYAVQATSDFATGKITGASLTTVIPDGAKILKIKLINRTSRNIRVRIPPGSKLMNRGPHNDEVLGIYREQWAPLSRFPSLVIDVPDTLAMAIDTNNSADSLFEIATETTTTQTITLQVTYQTMV